MAIAILGFIIGIIIIVYGGDTLVNGAVKIAKATGISEVIIGATIVSIGTTLPEMLVTVISSLNGKADLALGNAVGSIIFNTAVIGGIATYYCVKQKFQIKDILWRSAYLIGGLGLFYFLLLDGNLSRFDGFLLVVGLLIYLWLSGMNSNEKKEIKLESKITITEFIKIIIGALLLYIGAELIIKTSVLIAGKVGLSEKIIGLTIVSIGTSLPELVTMIVSIVKKHNAVGFGNIIGANILNIFSVCGIAALIKGINLTTNTFGIDIIIVLCLTLILISLPLIKKKTSKIQSIILLLSYISYVIILFIRN